jgi:CRISPR system Cascade subunit CasE
MVDKDEALSLGLIDGYAWHQAFWEAFPGHDGEKRSFLFRVDEKERFFQAYLLSELLAARSVWGSWEPKEISSGFLSHKRYLFQLRANPTKRIGKETDKGKRIGIYKEEDLKAWLTRKAEQSGFKTANFAVSKPIAEYFRKSGSKQNKLSRVDFEGILEVVDKEKFKKAFNDGVGSAKSLGYGMLILKPIE